MTKRIDGHITVDLDMEDLEPTKIESSATYTEIREYVEQQYGFTVSNLYIAQVKESHGLPMRENYNPSKEENHKIPQCPEEKRGAIEKALEHFNML